MPNMPKIVAHAGVIVTAHNQTVAEVSGETHQSGVFGVSDKGTGFVAGGGGSGKVETRIVSVEKGVLKRYADGHELTYALHVDPFFRVGQHAALLCHRGEYVGAGKLETGQITYPDLDFGRMIWASVLKWVVVIPLFLLAFVALTFNIFLAGGSALAFLLVVIIREVWKHRIRSANLAALRSAMEEARTQWAPRIAETGRLPAAS